MKEEYAIVLDFLPNGYPFDNAPMHKKAPIIQALGMDKFVLFELAAKKEVSIQLQEKVYIGDDKRDKVHHINGRIGVAKLTQTASSELPYVVKEVVGMQEKRFVEFFNTARPLSMRMHQLELLPGLGKKHMWQVLEEKRKGPFLSFEDLKKRLPSLPDPQQLIVKRIMKEIDGKEKNLLFVRE
ncbi:MAG: DUF655 domain-containing protein [Candidatus Woesearchaeota archaeon]